MLRQSVYPFVSMRSVGLQVSTGCVPWRPTSALITFLASLLHWASLLDVAWIQWIMSMECLAYSRSKSQRCLILVRFGSFSCLSLRIIWRIYSTTPKEFLSSMTMHSKLIYGRLKTWRIYTKTWSYGDVFKMTTRIKWRFPQSDTFIGALYNWEYRWSMNVAAWIHCFLFLYSFQPQPTQLDNDIPNCILATIGFPLMTACMALSTLSIHDFLIEQAKQGTLMLEKAFSTSGWIWSLAACLRYHEPVLLSPNTYVLLSSSATHVSLTNSTLFSCC